MSIDIIYISNFLDEKTASRRGIGVYSYAANNKILGLAQALKPWQKVAILSTGRGGAVESHDFHQPTATREAGIPVYYSAFYFFPLVSYLLSAISLGLWVLKLYRKYPDAKYIIYNRRPIYLLAVFFISILKIRCYLDLEDGGSEFHTRGMMQKFLDNLLIRIFDHVCSSGALIACDYLRQETRIAKIMHYYGVLTKKNTVSRDWHEGKLQVIFGGTLMEGAGTNIFMEAVSMLYKNHLEIAGQFLFVITGVGEMSEPLKLFSEQFDNNYIEFRGNLSRHKFQQTMDRVHIGLNLRDKSFLMAQDTFPSKVMGITAYGQLLISTKTSDVPKIFTPENILFLDDLCLAKMLVNKLVWVSQNRQLAEMMSINNQTDMLYRFSPSKTAREVIKFLSNENY